jgi:hypothetical protein
VREDLALETRFGARVRSSVSHTQLPFREPCGRTRKCEAIRRYDSSDEAVLAQLREYQNPGEADFVTELIGVFNDDLIKRLNQIRAGLQATDADQVSQAADALKGAGGEPGALG